MVKSTTFVRIAIQRDFGILSELDKILFKEPLTVHDFAKIHRCRKHTIKIMEFEEDDGTASILGYMIYELGKRSYVLSRIGVLDQRKGVGTYLVRQLIKKLHPERRREIQLVVPEVNLESQLFFKSLGFCCCEKIAYEGEDYYKFEYSLYGFLKNRFVLQKQGD